MTSTWTRWWARVAGFAALAVSVGACASVPGADAPVEPVPAGTGRPVATAPPPATGPARPSPGCSATPAAPTPVDGTRKLTVGGTGREYLLHVPAGVGAGTPAPLVLDMHGMGMNAGLEANVTAWSALADREGFVVVEPQGLNNIWTFVPDGANADITFLTTLVTAVQAERCIDLSRTYAGGISMGGLVASALACRAADPFAAFGLVSGMQWKPACAGAPARPAIVFWGSRDCVLPWFGNMGPCLAIGPPGRTQPTAPVPPGEDNGFPPVDQVVTDWADHNGCDPGGDTTTVSPSVTHRVYSGCRDGAGVELYFIEGGGHTWPGSQVARQMEAQNPNSPTAVTTAEIDATSLIWAFYRAHQLTG